MPIAEVAAPGERGCWLIPDRFTAGFGFRVSARADGIINNRDVDLKSKVELPTEPAR
jgi:hypothetical protein